MFLPLLHILYMERNNMYVSVNTHVSLILGRRDIHFESVWKLMEASLLKIWKYGETNEDNSTISTSTCITTPTINNFHDSLKYINRI